jgi:hypothetical protein
VNMYHYLVDPTPYIEVVTTGILALNHEGLPVTIRGGDNDGDKLPALRRSKMDDLICELPKNSREKIIFRPKKFKGHWFCDIRICLIEPGEGGENAKGPVPTKKGLAVSPALWPQSRAALDFA